MDQAQLRTQKPKLSLAFKVASVYVIFSLLWIYFSDRALESMVQTPDALSEIQTYKGWFFVTLSGLLIFSLTALGLRQNERIKKKLDQHSSFLQQVLQGVNHGIIQYTLQGDILFANRAACKLYGYQGELPAHLSALCLSADDSRYLTTHIAALAEDDQSEGFIRLPQVQKTGNTFTAYFQWSVRYSETGLLESITVSISDISEQQKHQEEMDQAALVFEMSDEAYLITDVHSRILNINPAFTKITGYELEDVKGKTPEIFQSGKHDNNFYKALWNQLLSRGQWQGEIINRNKEGEDQHIWQKIMALKDANGNVQKYISMMYEINNLRDTGIDDLTQLPNLPQLRDRLNSLITEAEKNREFFCIAYLDLDNFQAVNDSFGHQVGDLLVQAVAQRLTKCSSENDLIARQGGDEFIILGRNLNHEGRCSTSFARRLLSAFEKPFSIEGHKLFITASIGLCCYPQDGTVSTTLLRNADTALYRAKDIGKNNFQFYTSQLTSNAIQKMKVELDLRQALAESPAAFNVFYQPQIDLQTGQVCSAEALVRWQHDGTQIGPNLFIPVAEATGLIIPLGLIVLEQSCRDFLTWQSMGIGIKRVCVNVSMVQLLRSDFYHDLLNILQKTGMPAASLELEVTETALMKEDDRVVQALQQLRVLGIQIAIDDFGTGYSSLGRLQKLPVDRLKIDQSFMPKSAEDQNDHALISSVISLATSLHLEVIAEGVETEYQAKLLMKSQCEMVQGYLYSPPIPMTDFINWCQRA